MLTMTNTMTTGLQAAEIDGRCMRSETSTADDALAFISSSAAS